MGLSSGKRYGRGDLLRGISCKNFFFPVRKGERDRWMRLRASISSSLKAWVLKDLLFAAETTIRDLVARSLRTKS